MKLTKYGFHLGLLGFSSVLSVLGIIVSIIGTIGGMVLFWVGTQAIISYRGIAAGVTLYVIGGIALILKIPYIIMWTLLKIKTSKQDIPGIEKIGKIYSYVSGSLEIIGAIAVLIVFSIALHSIRNQYSTILTSTLNPAGYYHQPDYLAVGYIFGSVIYLIFACLKIHGTRLEKNKLLGTYLGFRYALFILHTIAFLVQSLLIWERKGIVSLIFGFLYFILDIGLTVILHSIRVNRENTAGTENPMKNF